MDEKDLKTEKISKIIELVNNSELSSIKQTLVQILSVINDPGSSAKDLKGVIEIDPTLSAKMLKLANSAYYGFAKRISEIQDSIVCIGFDAVKELALSQKICEIFEKNDSVHGYSRISLWKHSIATAVCGRLIYKNMFREGGDLIYAAGLLHDIGIIVMDQFLQEEFVNVLSKKETENDNLVDMEDVVLDFNHMDIGFAVAQDWALPQELCMAIGKHHIPGAVGGRFSKIVSTVFISEYITQNREIGYDESPNKDYTAFQKCLTKLKIREKALDIIVDEVEKEINKMEEAGWF